MENRSRFLARIFLETFAAGDQTVTRRVARVQMGTGRPMEPPEAGVSEGWSASPGTPQAPHVFVHAADDILISVNLGRDTPVRCENLLTAYSDWG
jgi:hypothetical protein